MKKTFLPIIGVMLFITIVGLLTQKNETGKFDLPFLPQSQETPIENRTLKIGEVEIIAEVADSDDKRAKGLGGRTSLEDNHGMLFVFSRENTQPIFWMKEMLIAIDIIWINDTKIVKVDANIQPPTSEIQDRDLIKYSPGEPIDYVLEVTAGFSEKNNIKVGDEVIL